MAEIGNADSPDAEVASPPRQNERDFRYAELAAEMAAHSGLVVGVMWDARFAGQEVPAGLRFSDIAEAWGTLPGVKVVALDADQVRSYSILFRGRLDILVFPYGSVCPMEAYGCYSGQAFNHFLRRGGAVLTSGGIPFARQASPGGHVVPIDTPAQLTEVFDKWIARFGVKFYQCSETPDVEIADPDLLPGIVPAWTPSATGVVVVNSAHAPVPKPPSGNVFPERTPARCVLPLLTGRDRWGGERCVSAVLSQDFIDGSRRVHFTHEAAAHPLTPGTPHFLPLMRRLFSLLANRVCVQEVAAEYACYRQGEAVAIHADLTSHESAPVTIEVEMTVTEAAGAVVYRHRAALELGPGTTRRDWSWAPGHFVSDEYTVRVAVRRDGAVVSKAANAWVVWDDAVVARGSRLGIGGNFLTVEGKPAFITGTNYVESTRGEAMWFRPDVAAIVRDHRQMRACGVNMIRPHYHPLKWFRDYLLYEHGELPAFYRELADCTDPMPDERAWRIWDLFIYLGRKYGIAYNGDLFTLVPEEMGDPRGWFGTVEAVHDRSRRACQIAFLLALDRRYRQVPGIAWDLFNEPYWVDEESNRDWARELVAALRADGSDRLVTIGGPMGVPGIDFDAPHGRLGEDWQGAVTRPLLLQELHCDRVEHLAADLDQAEGLRDIVVVALRKGACGWMPWSWTRQMRLWQDSYEHHHSFPMEKWDDRLGLHTHEDGTLKPAGILFRALAVLLTGIHPTGYDADRSRIATSAGWLVPRLPAETGAGYEILHLTDGRCAAGMARGMIVADGRILLCGPESAYVFLCETGPDGLLVKCERPGELRVACGRAAAVELVDPTPDGCRVLATVAATGNAGETRIAVEPPMTRYWLRLRLG